LATTGRLHIDSLILAAIACAISTVSFAQGPMPGGNYPFPPTGPTIPTVPGVVPNAGNPGNAGVPLAPPMQNFGVPLAPPMPGLAVGPVPAQAVTPEGQLEEGTQVAAIVGDQVILVGDLLPQILAALKQHGDKLSAADMKEQRKIGVQQLLPQVIEQKLLYLDFLRSIPADKIEEIRKKLSDAFDKTKLDGLMESMQANGLVELESKLREFNSSIEKQRRRFAEQQLAQEMVRRNVKHDAEITLADMARYYLEHAADFDLPEKVRWEKLSSDFTATPDKAQAWKLVAGMGNRVVGGASLAEIAKKESQGVDASDGGQHDWTQRGSLTSKIIEDAIFVLPEGKLSQIIEDANGFHIIRVIKRQAAGKVPFEEAQVTIKEKLKKERIRKQIVDYIDGLKAKTRVWTMFDNDVARKPSP